MLQIRGLSKTYANGVHALKNVDLDIPRGMFGLLGPNGAGKSSLMRTLATLQEADSGSATLTTAAAPSITVTVDQKPDEAGFDPYNKLIDRVSADNRKRVTVQ